jgi:prepilin-type N-terminal cleavage/methylation domain-containing protein
MARKGFALIEMIAVMVILAAVAVACNSLFHSLLSDLPRTCRTFNANTSADSIVDKIRTDVDRAVSLPLSFGSLKTDENLLLIEVPEGVIAYRKSEKQLLREPINVPSGQTKSDSDHWDIETVNIHWEIWNQEGTGLAVELTTSVNQDAPGRIEKRLENSHVFFMRVLPEEIQAE